MESFVLFDKPSGWKNKDILGFLKRKFGSKQPIGHSGTLDPFASGLMVVGIGRKFTRKLQGLLLGAVKEYEAEIEFSKISNTYDRDGEVVDSGFMGRIEKEDLEKAMRENFLGKRMQAPPVFSAKKVKGQRLRDLAGTEEGERVRQEKAKEVELINYKVVSFDYPLAMIRIAVSSGFYVRSLVHELGQVLGCGAYVRNLRRTKEGYFFVERALEPDDFDGVIELRGVVKGRVQGVGFRYFLKEEAEKLEITGYAQNREDGSVEFVAQGYLKNLDKLQKEILKGPDFSKVEDFEAVLNKPLKDCAGFVIF